MGTKNVVQKIENKYLTKNKNGHWKIYKLVKEVGF